MRHANVAAIHLHLRVERNMRRGYMPPMPRSWRVRSDLPSTGWPCLNEVLVFQDTRHQVPSRTAGKCSFLLAGGGDAESPEVRREYEGICPMRNCWRPIHSCIVNHVTLNLARARIAGKLRTESGSAVLAHRRHSPRSHMGEFTTIIFLL